MSRSWISRPLLLNRFASFLAVRASYAIRMILGWMSRRFYRAADEPSHHPRQFLVHEKSRRNRRFHEIRKLLLPRYSTNVSESVRPLPSAKKKRPENVFVFVTRPNSRSQKEKSGEKRGGFEKTAIILIYDGISVVYAWSFFGRFCVFLPIFARFFSRDFLTTSETLAMRGIQSRCF